MTLVLSGAQRVRMLAHAREEAPRECCGLLLGTAGAVAEVWPARNELPGISSYRIDPRDHFAAIRRARSAGLSILGAYHSHPRSAPEPSARDLEDAWPELVYVIVSLEEASRSRPVRAWRLMTGNFAEVALVTPTEECDAPCLPDSPERSS